MAWIVKGRIDTSGGSNVTLPECLVEIFFEQRGPANTTDLNSNVTIRGRASAPTNPSGQFEVTLPDRAELTDTPLRFVVSAPTGQTIGDTAFTPAKLNDQVRIPVSPIQTISLTPPANIPKPLTRRITGQVIDANGKSVPSNLQVMIFARKLGDDQAIDVGKEAPMFAARTDGAGYFFGETSNEEAQSAIARVAGVAEEIPIPLEDRLIPARVLLVINLPDTLNSPPKQGDCGCISLSSPPRTPTHADIENSPVAYSADLGTGQCVQFNVPNRAIEEFDFYTVVRTTEPEIRGLTVDGAVMGAIMGAAGAMEAATGVEAAEQAAEKAENEATTAQQGAAEADATANRAEGTAAQTEADMVKAKNAAHQAQVIAATARAKATTLTEEAASADPGSTGNSARNAAIKAKQQADAMEKAANSAADAANASATVAQAAAAAARTARAAAVTAKANAAAAESTAKEARTAVAAATANAETAKAGKNGASRFPGRARLDASNPVDWDSTPTFYEAATIAHGHLLHFKQTWYADGYSLGDLLYSLPLAPGQKKLISIVDWERRESTDRSEATFGNEELNFALTRDRDVSEVVTGALTESARGGSKNTTTGIGAGTGGAGYGSYQSFNFGALLGASGGYGESDSGAWQDSARSLASSSLQNLRDRTMQSASATRGLRSTVVQTVAQGETVRATTEVIANHNHCHALTIQYFEVLRHLKLVHDLTDVQECLFVPLPMTIFDRAKALRWRQSLETYLQRHDLSGGFDATRRVETGWSETDYPINRYADETILSLSGEMQITINIPLPPFPERPQRGPQDTGEDMAKVIAQATNPTASFLGGVLAFFTGGATAIASGVTNTVGQGAHALAEDLFALPTAQERYDKFQREVMPSVAVGFVDQLELWLLTGGIHRQIFGADFTLVSDYQPGTPLLVSLRATLPPGIARGDVSQLIIKSSNGLPAGCRVIVNSATFRYRAQQFEHTLLDDRRVNDDIDLPKIATTVTDQLAIQIDMIAPGKGATLYTPIDSWEQRSPRTEDRRLSAELIAHLNDNFEFYHHAIWWTMDPNRRYMLLDGYKAPNSAGRSVASVVENHLIGIVGNSLILPVARGNHLDPHFRYRDGQKGVDLLQFYALTSPVPPGRVSLPTRGVFAEAVMGSCNACEQIDDSRFWRWQDAPIDEPPPIDPNALTTRRSDPANVQPTSFPTPIVSIQNAPSAPEPASVNEALRTLENQSFHDITGLSGTQANAAAAYNKAVDTALQFGKEASTLAQQAAMINAKDKVLGAIDGAEQQGKIDANEAKNLRLKALNKMIGDTPQDTKASSIADRMKVIDEQETKGNITKEKAAGFRDEVIKGLSSDNASTDDEQKAATETIRKIPPEAIKSVSTRDTSGKTTTIKANPKGTSGTSVSDPGSSHLVPLANIPLDPGNGGRSIGPGALELGDIILSTTPALVSGIIRLGTNSPVSHAILYAGGSMVVEAVGEGVLHRPIQESLADANFAVALRYQGLTPERALRIIAFAADQVGKPYDYHYGVFNQALFRLDLLTYCL